MTKYIILQIYTKNKVQVPYARLFLANKKKQVQESF